ncbi:MAG: hypothetical protein ABSG53_02775 [Thermoguttaceae bacterium]|jgi:hypothetical protein
MQDKVEAPQTDDYAPEWFLEFIEDDGQPSRWGFNPRARGYQKAASRRLVLFIILCCAVATIIVDLWFYERLSAWQVVLGILFPMMPLAAALWSWRKSRFCKHCGVRTKDPHAAKGLIWCPACHGLTDPAGILREPPGRMDLTDARYLGHADPVMKCVDLVMLFGIKDHATEIRFEPEQHSFEIRLVVQNEVYDLVPPPTWLHVPVTQTVKAVAGLDLATCDRRQEGHIDIYCGGHHVPADVVVEPTDFGQKVTLRFLTEYWLPTGGDKQA